MKPNIKHVLLTLLGLSIGFVVTFEAAAGPSVTVPGNSCQARKVDNFSFRSDGAIEGRNGSGNRATQVFCPLAHSSEVEKIDVDIHANKRNNDEEDLVCFVNVRDSEGDRFVTKRSQIKTRGPRVIGNIVDVPADGFVFLNCRLFNGDRIDFITVEDRS